MNFNCRSAGNGHSPKQLTGGFAACLRSGWLALVGILSTFAQFTPANASNQVPSTLLPAPQEVLSFLPNTISANGTSQMSIELINHDPNAITGVHFVLPYPAGMTNAPSNPIIMNTCGGQGTVQADPNAGTLSLAQGTIPGGSGAASGICEIIVNVVASVPPGGGVFFPAVQSDNAQPGNSTSDNLWVNDVPLLLAPIVSKSFSPDAVPIGVVSLMTITLQNPNPNDDILGAQINDFYPLGLSNSGAVPVAGDTCGFANVEVTTGFPQANLAGGTVPAGGQCSVTIKTTPNGALASMINASGEVPSANAQTGQSASATLTMLTQPDLTLGKTHFGNFTQGQTGATYTLIASNIGDYTDGSAVTVTDTLPPSLTATAMSGSGWTCSLATTSCTRSNQIPFGASYPPITLTVNVAMNAPASVTNTATVSGGGETNTSNDGANDPTKIDPASGPDVTLTKSHAGNFSQGQTGAVYSLIAHNVGSGSTNGSVTVADVLPASMTATGLSGPGWNCSLATLTCTRSDVLPAAASYPAITLTVDVAANAPANVTNTATVSGGGESNTANDTAADMTVIDGASAGPDLTLTKSHAGNFRQAQPGAVYSLIAHNVGGASTSGLVTVTDTLPASLTATDLSGPGWTCTLATLSCTRSDTLAAGLSYPAITLTVNVADKASDLTNTATVSGGGETNANNNAANDPTTVDQLAPGPDLSLTKNHADNFAQGQFGATYKLTVHSIGDSATSGTVTVTDILPPPLSAIAMYGPGWNCSVATTSCTRNDALAPGSSYSIALEVDVPANAPPSVVNFAAVSGGNEVDPNDDAANDPTTITPSGANGPDLTLTKSHAGNFTQGQTGATYTLTAQNVGNSSTGGTVTVTDTLPPSLTPTAMSGSGWTCNIGTTSCTRSDPLTSNAAYPSITLTVNVAANAPASVTNTASVAGGGEANTANDGASDPTTIDPASAAADLTLTKSHAGNFTQGQTGATYSLVTHNIGNSSTNGAVTVADTLPASLAATAMSGTGWNCSLATTSCTRNDALPSGASYPTITLTVDVAPNAPASVTNNATVSGGGETNTVNDSAADPTTIDSSNNGPDLTLTKTHAGNFSQGETGASYTLTVHNAGNAPTNGAVTVTDSVPPALSVTGMSGSGWNCTPVAATCTRSNVLGANASYPAITLTVDVAPNAPANITNTATVSGGGEVDTSNDTASDPTAIQSAGGNHAPVAVGDEVQVAHTQASGDVVGDAHVVDSVLDNDIDADSGVGDTLTAVKLSNPLHGTLTFNADGTFTYQNVDNVATDSFAYKACDSWNVCSAVTTVTITIGDGLDNHVPFAAGDAIEVTPGNATSNLVGDPHATDSVLDNDIDPDSDALTATKLTDPSSGTLAFNANGTFAYSNTDASATTDSFVYEACDTHGACDLGTVSITIGNGPADHAPIVVDDAIQVAPGQSADTLIGDLNDPGSVLDNDTDPDAGDALTALKTGPLLSASGDLSFNADGTFTYQNTDLAATSDMFLYEACDNIGACSPGIVSISIKNGALDRAPIPMDDAIDVAPHGSADTLVGGASSVLANDTDPDPGETTTLVAHLISAPQNGHVTVNSDGTFSYVNDDPAQGVDSFEYEACDTEGACTAATVSVTINGQAPAVTCQLAKQVDVVGNTVNLDLSLLFTPPAGQSLSYGVANPPPSLSIMGSLLSGTLDTAGTYTSSLTATTVPGGASASEDVIFEVLPANEILLRDGFDGATQSQACQ